VKRRAQVVKRREQKEICAAELARKLVKARADLAEVVAWLWTVRRAFQNEAPPDNVIDIWRRFSTKYPGVL
jgi:hypothetical protein